MFITCVTQNRRQIFNNQEYFDLFWKSVEMVKDNHTFELIAYVILPDHFHWLIKMPDNDPNFSKVLLSFKWNFTLNFKRYHHISSSTKLWQRGFWDHIIRNEGDLQDHMDYIHWNPVKHSYTTDPENWLSSSYKDWKIKGVYCDGWGMRNIPNSIKGIDYE